MNFSFHIFGAPHGFELYQGKENEIGYFQTFDNGNKENAKLTIHRMANGQVSYSYLRYNFITSGGRGNSFFGMSVVFNQEYCADIENLYKLFDSVYKTILQNRILIEEIKDNLNAQAKYLVRSFTDADSEVKRIENIVSKNVENEFANDVHPISELPSVPQKNVCLTAKINLKKGNAVFLTAQREYPWVYISPDYKIIEEPILSDEAIAGLDGSIEKIQTIYNNISLNALKGINIQEDIKTAWEQTQNGKELIKPYLRTQPELQERDNKLNNLHNLLIQLHSVAFSKTGTGQGGSIPEPPINFGDNGESEPKPSPELLAELEEIINKIENNINDLKKKKNVQENFKNADEGIKSGKERITSWLQEQYKFQKGANIDFYLQRQSGLQTRYLYFINTQQKLDKQRGKKSNEEANGTKNKNKKRIYWIAGIAAFAVIAALLFWFRPQSPPKPDYPDTPKYNELVNAGDSLIKIMPVNLENIDKAIAKYDSAKILKVENNTAESKIDNAKKMARDTLKARAEAEFNKGGIGNVPKMDGYKAAVALLKMISDKKYGADNDYKEIVNNYKEQTIGYYTDQIGGTTDAKDKLKYANFILELDPNDEFALKTKELAEALLKPAPQKPVPADHAGNRVTTQVSAPNENEPCYVNVGISDKVTVDKFLDNIEAQLRQRQTNETHKTLTTYLEKVISNNVGCEVTSAQIKRAKELKDRPRKFKDK